jgi:hypothetical protein
MSPLPDPSKPRWWITVCSECRRQVERQQVPQSPWPSLFVYWCPEHGALRDSQTERVEMVPKDPKAVVHAA